MTRADLDRIRMRTSDPVMRYWTRPIVVARLREARADVETLLAEVERLQSLDISANTREPSVGAGGNGTKRQEAPTKRHQLQAREPRRPR